MQRRYTGHSEEIGHGNKNVRRRGKREQTGIVRLNVVPLREPLCLLKGEEGILAVATPPSADHVGLSRSGRDQQLLDREHILTGR
jgi:hypothetical protein